MNRKIMVLTCFVLILSGCTTNNENNKNIDTNSEQVSVVSTEEVLSEGSNVNEIENNLVENISEELNINMEQLNADINETIATGFSEGDWYNFDHGEGQAFVVKDGIDYLDKFVITANNRYDSIDNSLNIITLVSIPNSGYTTLKLQYEHDSENDINKISVSSGGFGSVFSTEDYANAEQCAYIDGLMEVTEKWKTSSIDDDEQYMYDSTGNLIANSADIINENYNESMVDDSNFNNLIELSKKYNAKLYLRNDEEIVTNLLSEIEKNQYMFWKDATGKRYIISDVPEELSDNQTYDVTTYYIFPDDYSYTVVNDTLMIYMDIRQQDTKIAINDIYSNEAEIISLSDVAYPTTDISNLLLDLFTNAVVLGTYIQHI